VVSSLGVARADVQHNDDERITIQLLGKEDLTIDDAESTQEKWRQYIESYVLVSIKKFS
jgi:histone deacetylase complex regulatory component SIN3